MNSPSVSEVFFTSVPSEYQKALRALCVPRQFARGEMVFCQGEPGSLIYIIETGRIEISVTAQSGRKTILNQMGPGDVIGELAMLDGGPRSADAVAATASTGQILTRQKFYAFLHQHPVIAVSVLEEVCRKLRDLSDLHADQIALDGHKRLAAVLARLFRKWGTPLPGGEIRLTQKFSQTELGDFAGLARENVNRAMTAWKKQELLRSDGGLLVLRDLAELDEIAQG
jgi:CRP-like cAMP-binding protein